MSDKRAVYIERCKGGWIVKDAKDWPVDWCKTRWGALRVAHRFLREKAAPRERVTLEKP